MSTKKKFRVPHSFVIVFSIIIAAVLLTWIIPAGEYVRVENADGIKVIDPTQFNYIARTPVNPLLIPMYIVKAFIKRVAHGPAPAHLFSRDCRKSLSISWKT